MSYKNAKDVLPDELIREIQKYIDGDLLYIPTKSEKTEWGICSGAGQKYAEPESRDTREIQGERLDRGACQAVFSLNRQHQKDRLRPLIGGSETCALSGERYVG